MKQVIEMKTRRSLLLNSNSGQAVIEYILIVSIAVSILFILKDSFRQISTFTDNYMGKYTACLMEFGELPSLGVTDESLKDHQSTSYKCEASFQPFTLTAGRPPVEGSGSGQSASARDQAERSTGSGDRDSNSAADRARQSSSTRRDSEATGGGRGGGQSSSSNSAGNNIRRSGRGTADGAGSANAKVRSIEEAGLEEEGEGFSGPNRRPRQSRVIYRNREKYRAVTGQQAQQIQAQLARTAPQKVPGSRTIAKAEEGFSPGPRTGIVNPPPVKPVIAQQEQDEGWGFGNLIRILLIIGIVVAIVIFFGGQLLNYSNSDS